jgi:preprotein translocase subunit SecE
LHGQGQDSFGTPYTRPPTRHRRQRLSRLTTPPKKRTSIPQFASQVRAEGRKIVWPSRKETWITSVMVFIMVLIATIFFFAIVDFGLTKLSQVVLAIGQ